MMKDVEHVVRTLLEAQANSTLDEESKAYLDKLTEKFILFLNALRSEVCMASVPCRKRANKDCDSPTCSAWRKLLKEVDNGPNSKRHRSVSRRRSN